MSVEERVYEIFVFLLVEGMSMMAFASAIKPLRAANRFWAINITDGVSVHWEVA